MDAITSYLDHMFRGLPKTDEVAKAQRELQQMCEDRYHELREEGVSEHEAVGRVITQFGDLDEVADELGIRAAVDGRPIVDDRIDVSRADAERFLQVRRRAAWLIAGGIVVILLGVTSIIYFSELAPPAADLNPIALALFFVAIAIAVAMFITGGMSMSRFNRFERHELRLDPATADHYRDLREREHGRYTASIVIGVLIIILGFGTGAVGGMLADGDFSNYANWLVSPMPLIISVGVAVLVIGGMRRGSLDRLTSEGDYDPDARKRNELLEKIAGPYWLLTVLVFLAWSFIGDAWSRSWIIWPIAGVLFAVLAVTLESFFGDRETKRR